MSDFIKQDVTAAPKKETTMTLNWWEGRSWGNMTFDGTRLQVWQIIGALQLGETDKELLEAYNSLKPEWLIMCRELIDIFKNLSDDQPHV